MITQIEIGNFKAFGDIQTIKLSDINLLFGSNSAGKSTILQAFAYLDQAFHSKNWNVHKTRLGGEYMDLGGLKNIVHKHDTNRIIHLGITATGFKVVSDYHLKQVLGDQYKVSKRSANKRIEFQDPNIYFDTTYTIRIGLNPKRLDALEYFELIEEESTLWGIDDRISELPKHQTVFKLSRKGNQFEIIDVDVDTLFFRKSDSLGASGWGEPNPTQDPKHNTPSPSQINKMLKGGIIDADNDQFIGFFLPKYSADTTLRFLKEITYTTIVGLMNSHNVSTPESTYDADILNSKLNTELKWSKLNTELNLLSSFLGLDPNNVNGSYPFSTSTQLHKIFDLSNHVGYVRTTPERQLTPENTFGTIYEQLLSDNQLLEDINAQMTFLGMGLEIIRMNWSSSDKDDLRDISTLELYDHRRRTSTSFRDVGQGIIQIIPVIASILGWPYREFHSDIRGFRFIEQPELHVHPAIQSGLGRLLAKQHSKKTESIVDLSSNIISHIIETHSEHLIKALQVEVARFRSTNGKEGLEKSKVTIHYVSWDEEKSQSIIRTLELDENGSFTEPWPEDFFGLSGDLSIERLRLMNRN